jgi:lysophospholipase L1-like esterase
MKANPRKRAVRLKSIAGTVLLAVLGIRTASADDIALYPTVSSGTQTFDTLFGMDFDTNQPISVTKLGVFDNNADGILNTDSPTQPIVVQIWNRNTGLPLATLDFGGGSSNGVDTTVGGGKVFFQNLSTPLLLPAGGDYYISEDYSGAEKFANVNAPASYTPPTTDASGAISFVGGGRGSQVHQVMYNPSGGTNFTTNGFIDGGPAARYTGPDFQFNVTAPASPPVNLGNIMPLGDSVTDGFQSVAGSGYRYPLYTDLQNAGYTSTYVGSATDNPGPLPANQQHHEGHSGYVIEAQDPTDPTSSGRSGILDNINSYIGPAGANPNYILLDIGINDVDLNYDPGTPQGSEQGARLAALINAISNKTTGLRPNAHLIVAEIGPTETPSENVLVQDYNHYVALDVAAAQAAGENVSMVDMYDALNPAVDLADNLHPNDAGYAIMANVWLNGIEALQPVPEPTCFAILVIGFTGLVTRRRTRQTNRHPSAR